MLEIKEKKIMLGDKEAVIKIGEYAHQANGSVTIQCGETVVQSIVTMGRKNPDLDFFPLSVEYNENLYAGGRIKGSRFTKRQGRPADDTILKCRLIDRSIRPMFPKNFKREVQVVVNILSSDGQNPHDVIGLTAVVAALAISDIPFDCNLGGIRVSKVDGEVVANPTYEQCENQEFELVLAGNGERIVMIESAAEIVTDESILEGFKYSFGPLGVISSVMKELESDFGKEKIEFEVKEIPADLIERIKPTVDERLLVFYDMMKEDSTNRSQFSEIVEKYVMELFSDEEIEELSEGAIREAIDYIFKKTIREKILKENKRIDGRDITEIREIIVKPGVLPRVHGSSMFMRGETQVLNIVTLAAPGAEQIIETIEGEDKKRYIHHYNAPPYSVGETGRMTGPGRREIGHGALAEKALIPVVPSKDEFPYVVMAVSEVMGQNGSSSMGSTCASTVSLMDAGVPIKAPVAGISVGLMTGEDVNEFVTLTDIVGVEDFSGDMDFKVAGTKEGITAIQMDTKIKGLTYPIIEKSVYQAHDARNYIIDKIIEAIPNSRKDVSEHAPRIESMKIPVDSIAIVIGSGGKTIKQLCADYDVDISIEEDGLVSISGLGKENIDNVKELIIGMTTPPEVGKVYNAKVVKIMDFGAFVEIFPGKEGLVHISEMADTRVNDVKDIVSMGDRVDVKLMEIDKQHRLNFTMLLDKPIRERTVSSRPERRR